jgi:hypothetical protein
MPEHPETFLEVPELLQVTAVTAVTVVPNILEDLRGTVLELLRIQRLRGVLVCPVRTELTQVTAAMVVMEQTVPVVMLVARPAREGQVATAAHFISAVLPVKVMEIFQPRTLAAEPLRLPWGVAVVLVEVEAQEELPVVAEAEMEREVQEGQEVSPERFLPEERLDTTLLLILL